MTTPRKQRWKNDGKFYISRGTTTFTLRRGYLRIDYTAGKSILLSRETTDPRDYCVEISADEFRAIRDKVFAALKVMSSTHAAAPLPDVDTGGQGEADDEEDDYVDEEDIGEEDESESADDIADPDEGVVSDEDLAADLLMSDDEHIGFADDDDEK